MRLTDHVIFNFNNNMSAVAVFLDIADYARAEKAELPLQLEKAFPIIM
jgi:hypothetical protein